MGPLAQCFIIVYNERKPLMRETLTVALAFKDYLSALFKINEIRK